VRCRRAPGLCAVLADILAAQMEQWVSHDMELGEHVPLLRIREVNREQSSFGVGSELDEREDGSGHYIWPAALVMARWLVAEPELLPSGVVYELGSGCGLSGLSAARAGCTVVMTDSSPTVLELLRCNIALNTDGMPQLVPDLAFLDWSDRATWPAPGCADVVMGTDLVYDDGRVSVLCQVIEHLLRPGGVFLHVHPQQGRMGVSELPDALGALGVKPIDERPAPGSLRRRSKGVGNVDSVSTWHLENALRSYSYVMQRYQKPAAVEADGASMAAAPLRPVAAPEAARVEGGSLGLGSFVRIVRLRSRPEHNGKCGFVLRTQESTEGATRFQVRCEDGTQFAFKVDNLELISSA